MMNEEHEHRWQPAGWETIGGKTFRVEVCDRVDIVDGRRQKCEKRRAVDERPTPTPGP